MTHAKSEVPGRSAAKARDTSPPQLRMIHRPKLTTTETRQAEHLVMFWVLIGCLTFAVITCLALLLTYGWIPLPWSAVPPK